MNETTPPDPAGPLGLLGERYVLLAIELAERSRVAGDAPFGSILVDMAGVVVRSERNTVTSAQDITAHPELKLARWAAQSFSPEVCRTLVMYTSCQPCPMGTNVIARAGIGQVVYALSTQQLQELKPQGHIDPDSAIVEYNGPRQYTAAIVPLIGYYE